MPGLTDDALADLLLTEIDHVFGGRGPEVMPPFAPGNAAELTSALADGPNALGGVAFAADDFLLDAAQVRSGAGRLQAALATAAGLAPSAAGAGTPDLRVAQLPFSAGARWAGLAPLAGADMPGGSLSLIAHTPPLGATTAGGQAGLMVDEWIEVVPGPDETTGVAFHYDAPGSSPPAGDPLAAPPARPPWQPRLARGDAARDARARKAAGRRSRCPEGGAGSVLPAMRLAFNEHNDTVSTDPTLAI